MQVTIDIKESAVDKIMYLLEHLKNDVKIISKTPSGALEIEVIEEDDPDYESIVRGRREREKHPERYGTLDDIDWD